MAKSEEWIILSMREGEEEGRMGGKGKGREWEGRTVMAVDG